MIKPIHGDEWMTTDNVMDVQLLKLGSKQAKMLFPTTGSYKNSQKKASNWHRISRK